MKRQSNPIIGIILAILTLTMLVSALSAAVGFVVVSNSSTRTGTFVQAFASGVQLTMIADEMAPEAFTRANIATGIATTLGFILAVFLTSLAKRACENQTIQHSPLANINNTKISPASVT